MKRIQFKYDGNVIYEWEQTLDEVNIYIQPPPQIRRSDLEVKIFSNSLQVGLKNTAAFINENYGGKIKLDESTWTFSDGEIMITLQKMLRGEMWTCALEGNPNAQIDHITQENIKKQLMLERFQEENPSFDFSSAEFNGMVPDAKDYMGGIQYK